MSQPIFCPFFLSIPGSEPTTIFFQVSSRRRSLYRIPLLKRTKWIQTWPFRKMRSLYYYTTYCPPYCNLIKHFFSIPELCNPFRTLGDKVQYSSTSGVIIILSKLPILSQKAGQTLWGRLLVIYVSCRPDLLNLSFANSLDSAFTVICKIDDQKLPKVFICKIVPYGFFRNYFQTESQKKVFNLAFFVSIH